MVVLALGGAGSGSGADRAALWVAAGASPNEIARRAGHSSVVTVLDRYGHLLPNHEDAVTDALDVMAEAAIVQTGVVTPIRPCHDRAMEPVTAATRAVPHPL